MERNPFEAFLSPELERLLDEDESLDAFIRGLVITNRLSWECNPWHHRLANWFVSLFSRPIKNEWIEHEPDEYFGQERRAKVRDYMDEYFTHLRRGVAMAMMPKTKKIEPLKDVA